MTISLCTRSSSENSRQAPPDITKARRIRKKDTWRLRRWARINSRTTEGNGAPSERSMNRHIDDASENSGPLLPTPNHRVIPQPQNLEVSQHRLISRANTSTNGPLIIGATVGGISFIGILIVAIVLWSRMVRSQKKVRHSQMTSVRQSPAMFNEGDDKVSDLDYIRRTPTSAAGAPRHSLVVSPSMLAPAPVVSTSQTRHHSLTPFEVKNLQPASLKRTSTVLTRATTQRSKISSPSSVGRRSKTSSSRFGSRDLSQPPSLHTVSSSWAPSPHRSPRPGEVGSEDGNPTQPQIFELSAHPSVKRKRNSKPLPVLPTYLVREHEEEMKRRREELEREKSEQATRRPQSFVGDSRTASPQPATPPSILPGPSSETKAQLGQTVLKKVMSLESLASTSSSSSSISDEGEPPNDARVLPVKVNALSPRSSQHRPTKGNSEQLPPIPSLSTTEAESESAGEDRISIPGNRVESTRTSETLRLPMPLPLPESVNVLDTIQAPISATVAKPHILSSPSQNFRVGSPEAHTMTQGTTAGDIAVSREKLMFGDNLSERALALSSVQDWRESVGQTYAATRPPTAASMSAGRSSPEGVNDIPALPAIVDMPILPLQPRPPLPKKISVDTGVGHLHSSPPTLVAMGRTFLAATSTATSSAASSPVTPLEKVPVSAVTPGSNVVGEQQVLRPPTPEREQERTRAERPIEVKGLRVGSWLDIGDSDSED